MLSITFVSGNIFDTDDKPSKYERLLLDRAELGKSRMRKKTDKNTDVTIVLEVGKNLRHGDILVKNDKIIVVEQTLEKVIAVKPKNNKVLVLIGHIIGNRHRPISIKDDTIYFPIQSESELEIFEMLFSDIIDDIELSIEEMIFIPHTGDVYEH